MRYTLHTPNLPLSGTLTFVIANQLYEVSGTNELHLAHPNPHPQYAFSGLQFDTAGSGLYTSGTLVGVDFTLVAPSGDYIFQSEANRFELSGTVDAHVALPDPHTQYLLESIAPTLYRLSGTGFDTTGSGLYSSGTLVGLDVAFTDARYGLSGNLLAGSGLILTAASYHVQVGSGLYLQDDLVGVDFTQVQLSGDYLTNAEGDAQYDPLGAATAAIAAHEAAADPHPQYLTQAEGDALYEVSGTVDVHEGLLDPHPQYLTSGEADIRYRLSGTGFDTVGSGLYSINTLVGFDTGFGDIRYALSGAAPITIAGSGLIVAGNEIHVQIGSGLYLQDDLVGVDFTQVAASGNYVTFAAGDVRYALSGTGGGGPSVSGRYIEQFSATNSVQITHNLGGYPQVSVLDTTFCEMDVQVCHDNVNQTTLSFNGLISGWFIGDVSTGGGSGGEISLGELHDKFVGSGVTRIVQFDQQILVYDQFTLYPGATLDLQEDGELVIIEDNTNPGGIHGLTDSTVHSDVQGTWVSGNLIIYNGANFVPFSSGEFVMREELLQQYALQLDEVVVSGITYIGEALPGTLTSASSWRIKRMDESDPTVEVIIEWADGNDSFDNIWDNRTSLSYS